MATAGEVQALLRRVTDPELEINIVDLGLVYGVQVEEGCIRVAMTLTTPACPLASVLPAQVEEVLRASFPGHAVEVSLVWEPRWTPEMASEDVRRQLGGQ